MEAQDIQKRYQCAENKALEFRSMYQKAYELCAPLQNSFVEATGGNKSPNVYDSTGSLATNSFVNTFMNTVTPVHSKWVELKAGVGMPYLLSQLQGIEEPTESDLTEIELQVNSALANITNDLFSFINASNMYPELASMYYDAAIGTGAMLVMPGDMRRGLGSPLRYRTISPYYLALEEGAFGEICGIYRTVESRARDAKAEWSDLSGFDYSDEEESCKFLEATIYNEKTGVWEYYVLKDNKILTKRTYTTNPWIIYRHSVIAGEVWGRGPVINALPDLLLLNAAEELSLRSSQISAYGCYTVISDDIINPNTVEILPGGMIPVKRNSGPSGPSIQPLPSIGNPNHQLLIKSDLQGKIRRFLLDESLPSSNEPRMTATEVIERVRKIQRDFGAVFGRISYELLQPLVQRSLDILTGMGLVQLPKGFDKIDSFTLKMQVISPVSRMQSLQDVESLMQTIQMLGSISPELVPQQMKLGELGIWLADKLGAPSEFFKSPEEQQQDQIAQQEQQMQVIQMQQAIAEAQEVA